MIASTLLALLLPALVSAHGYVNKVSIDGTVYQGNTVGTNPTVSSAIRQVNTNSPVKGATNPDLNCGAGAKPAAVVAKANPGSTVEVYWVGGTTGTSAWPHNTGPIMHYMAKCDGPCTSYDSSSAKWFKISEQALKPGNTTWYQAEIQSGSPATVTIPGDLAPGDYLLRSELIALQLAMTQGGAEFYPSCTQLTVSGSQSGQPSSSDEVSLPGAYSDTDPGILDPNVYNPPLSYVFPGPPVAAFISGGSGGGSSGGSGSVPSPSGPTPSGPTPSGPAPSGPTPSSPPSTSPTPSAPGNVGGSPPSSPVSSPSSTPSGGSSCMRKRSIPEVRVSVEGKKRMNRHRHRTSH